MNATTLKQKLEVAQNEITKLQQAIEKAEKQAKEATAIKLNVPKDGELYTNTVLGYPSIRHGGDKSAYFLYTFASTNKAQAKAFAEALQVMAELRCQEGIKFPDGKLCWSVRYNCLGGELHTYDYYNLDYQLMSPAFKTEEYAQKAIDNVGEYRIIEAYKTMMFMTPESRGEC